MTNLFNYISKINLVQFRHLSEFFVTLIMGGYLITCIILCCLPPENIFDTAFRGTFCVVQFGNNCRKLFFFYAKGKGRVIVIVAKYCY